MIFFTMVEENFEIWWPECLKNSLISHFSNARDCNNSEKKHSIFPDFPWPFPFLRFPLTFPKKDHFSRFSRFSLTRMNTVFSKYSKMLIYCFFIFRISTGCRWITENVRSRKNGTNNKMNTGIADFSHVNIKYFGCIYVYRIDNVIYLNILEKIIITVSHSFPIVVGFPPKSCIYSTISPILFQSLQINKFLLKGKFTHFQKFVIGKSSWNHEKQNKLGQKLYPFWRY